MLFMLAMESVKTKAECLACREEGRSRPARARGLCQSHYQKELDRRNGEKGVLVKFPIPVHLKLKTRAKAEARPVDWVINRAVSEYLGEVA